jgi:hypothetical protein
VAENVGGVMYNRTATPTGQPETATQVKTVTDNNVAINESERLNFLWSRGLLYTAQWKRIKKSKATYPGGHEALEMIKRCRARGVPQHIIDNGVDYVEPMVGVVTPGTTTTPEDQLQALMGVMDKVPPQARQQILRAAIGHMAGWENADSILPAEGDLGPGWQGQMAIQENAILSGGLGPLPVLVDQDHLQHLEQHTLVADEIEQEAAASLNTRENVKMEKGIRSFGDFVAHYIHHVTQLTQMPSPPPETPIFKNTAKKMTAAFSALFKAANKVMLANQRNEGNVPADQGGGGGDPAHDISDAAIKMRMAEMEMGMKQESHKQDMQNKQAKADLLMDNMKIKTSAKLQSEDMIGSAKAAAAAAQAAAKAPPPPAGPTPEQQLGF